MAENLRHVRKNRKSSLMIRDEQDNDNKRSAKNLQEYTGMQSYPLMLGSIEKSKSDFLNVQPTSYFRSHSQNGVGSDYETIEESENENRKYNIPTPNCDIVFM